MKQVLAGALWIAAIAGLLGAAGSVTRCDPAGRDVCEFNRPEDVAVVPGTDWIAVSQDSHAAPLVFVNVRSKARVAVGPPFAPRAEVSTSVSARLGAPDCPGPPNRFRGPGNDIRRVGSKTLLVLINHPDPGAMAPEDTDRVELLSIEMRGGAPEVHWEGCYPVALPYFLNDVALGPRGELFASHQFERTHSPEEAAALKQKLLTQAPTGFAVAWKVGEGWTRMPGTDLTFANGISVSADGGTLAVAGTYSQAVLLVNRKSGVVRRVPIPLQPDNIAHLADGSFLVVGHTGVPVTGVDPCRDPSHLPCGFPFAVARIDAQARVTVVFEHDGSRIPGASVAVPHGDQLFLGSFFGDRVTVLDRPAGVPRD